VVVYPPPSAFTRTGAGFLPGARTPRPGGRVDAWSVGGPGCRTREMREGGGAKRRSSSGWKSGTASSAETVRVMVFRARTGRRSGARANEDGARAGTRTDSISVARWEESRAPETTHNGGAEDGCQRLGGWMIAADESEIPRKSAASTPARGPHRGAGGRPTGVTRTRGDDPDRSSWVTRPEPGVGSPGARDPDGAPRDAEGVTRTPPRASRRRVRRTRVTRLGAAVERGLDSPSSRRRPPTARDSRAPTRGDPAGLRTTSPVTRPAVVE